MASSSRTSSVPLSADDVAGRTQASRNELKKRFEVTGSRSKVILLAGRPGTGKSSTLEDFTDLSGHSEQSVDSVTSEVQISRAVIEDEEYFIMDTPGFDPQNEKSTFLEIIRGIKAIQPYANVVGLLFFTCINAQRFDAFDRKLVAFIRALCGDEYIPNITFVTTFWTASRPKQQAVFDKQLEKLRRSWNDSFDGHAPRTYQHGREYNADGVDTGYFLDWFEDRDQIAQHGKNMIARYYGGPGHNNNTPKIVRELAAGTPVHETDAGRLLQIDPPFNGTKFSEKPKQDPRAESAQESRPADTDPDSPRESTNSTGSTQHRPPPEPQASSNWMPLLQKIAELGFSLAQKNGFSATYSSGQGLQMNNSGSTPNMQFTGDHNSVVDRMKFYHMDSSQAGRLRYATEHQIGGTPFSAAWNNSIRRDIQRRFG